MEADTEKVLNKIFEIFSISCINMHKLENEKFDKLIEELKNGSIDKKSGLIEIIELVRSVTDIKVNDFPIVDEIERIIQENIQSDLSLEEIAKKVGISQSYMRCRFKKATGVSVNKYKNALKITLAKKMIVNTDKSITDIAMECGFNNMWYFSERFVKSEGVTPTEYRRLLKK